MYDDVREWLIGDGNLDEYELQYNRSDLQERLYEELWCEDSVTGNASGSYTFNSYEAWDNLNGNQDLLAEALREFGEEGADILEKGAEACDVTVRCYLLGEVLDQVLDDLENEIEIEE